MHHDILKFAGQISRDTGCPMDDILPSEEMRVSLKEEMGVSSDGSPSEEEELKKRLAKEFEALSSMGLELGYLTPELEGEARKLFYGDTHKR